MWFLVAACTAYGEDEETRRFGLAGSAGFVWIYDSKFDADSGQSLLHIGARAPGAAEFFVPTALRGLVGSVHATTSSAGDLFLIFDEEGAHRRYRHEVMHRSLPRARAQTEQPLPGGALPLAFAGHSLSATLYAIVSREVASAITIDEFRRAREAESASEGEDSAKIDGVIVDEPIDVEARLGPARFFVARYFRNKWSTFCGIPQWFDQPEEGYLVVDRAGRVHLLFAEESPGSYQHASYSEGVWSSPGRVLDVPGYRISSACAGEEHIIVVGSTESGATRSIHASTFQEGSWEDQAPFVIEGVGTALGVSSFSSACVGDEIGLAILGDRAGLLFGRWKIEGGAPTEPLREVTGLGPGRRASISWQAQSMAAFVVLGILLSFTFLRRGDSITRDAELPSHYVVAAYWRRLASFAIDVAPIAITTNRLWAGPLNEWLAQYYEIQNDGGSMPPFSDELLISWALSCLAFVAYCIVCEALFARTPGKAIVGCRVVNEAGGRCSFSPILVRNLLRLIELFPLFQLWPTFILMLFTRSRQRLGDLLARTIVVENVPRPGAQDSAPASDGRQEGD
jgi:uncharacterized RDD family membrane protein YckC